MSAFKMTRMEFQYLIAAFLLCATDMQNWTSTLGFLLAAVTVSLRWTLVSLYPLGLEASSVGIHQRQPNYLPTYNGIFSIHALNFTSPSTSDSPHQLHINASLTEDEDRIADQNSKLYPEEGTAVNEVDSKDQLKIPEMTTFPQLHVITQTIGDVKTVEGENTDETQSSAVARDDDDDDDAGETTLNETSSDSVHTDSQTLLEGSEEDKEEDKEQEDSSSEDSEDLFDRLMRTIQGHWLDFVGKMKMSVLDVWKSISHHMMERLENFATVV